MIEEKKRNIEDKRYKDRFYMNDVKRDEETKERGKDKIIRQDKI